MASLLSDKKTRKKTRKKDAKKRREKKTRKKDAKKKTRKKDAKKRREKTRKKKTQKSRKKGVLRYYMDAMPLTLGCANLKSAKVQKRESSIVQALEKFVTIEKVSCF